MRRILAAIALALGSASGCSTDSPARMTQAVDGPGRQTELLEIADVRPEPLPLRVPIRGVMAGIIDFSAHGMFETSTSEMSLTENDWLAAGLAAINLISSTTLITTAGTGPHDADWVTDLEWRRWAREMQSASISAGVAITRKDRPAYLNAANRLANACQSCHDSFRPEAPLSNSQFAESTRRGLNLGQ